MSFDHVVLGTATQPPSLSEICVQIDSAAVTVTSMVAPQDGTPLAEHGSWSRAAINLEDALDPSRVATVFLSCSPFSDADGYCFVFVDSVREGLATAHSTVEPEYRERLDQVLARPSFAIVMNLPARRPPDDLRGEVVRHLERWLVEEYDGLLYLEESGFIGLDYQLKARIHGM